MKGIGIKSVGIISHKKLIFLILVAGLLLAGTVVPVFAGTSVSFDRFLPLTEQWHFNHPYNLATDQAGNIYVADNDDNLIRKFDGSKWSVIGRAGNGPGEFFNPRDVVVDSEGNIYVADYGNNRVQKLDSTGAYVDEWGALGGVGSTADGEFMAPSGLGLDSANNIFVTETGNKRVQKFSANGVFLEKYALPDSFAQSADVAVASNGTIYVSDSVKDSVYRFNGTSWTKLGKFGDDDGEFRSPGGLAVDQAGNLFVADINNHRVQKFDSNGVFVAKWGKAGGLLARSDDLGEFNAPHGVAVDPNGQVIVADTGNDRIQRWDGSAWEAWDSYGAENGSFLRPYAVTVDQSGNVYVADDGSNSIQQFDSKGVFVQKWGKADGSTGTGVGEFNDPAGLVVSNNILYVVDFGNHRLQKYDGTAWSILGERGSAAGQFEQPTGITADAGGTLYVADTGNHSIQKYDGAWSVIGELGDDAGKFANPHGVAVTADGTLYVTDTSNDRIQVYQNGTWTVLGGARTAGATGNAGTGVGSFSYPTGIVLDGLGRLFVLDSGNDRIQMLENGKWSAWGGPGSEIGEFDFPNGLAVVDNNTLMIADTDNHRIIRMKAIPTSDSSASVTAESIGKVTQSGTTYRVDITSSKLEEWIQNPAQTREIAIPIPAGMTEAAVGITLEDVVKMRAQKVALNISSAAASLKFSAPDLGKYVGEFGLAADPKQLKLVVSINRKELTSLPEYQNLAVNKLTILSPAIEFAVAMTDGKRTLPVKQFAEYTKRLIPLPAGITYGPNTTAVSLGQGGRLLHQPTKIITTAEGSFAEILSRQNETFVIVSKDATFPDLGSYEWAKETVESMASRMIINGVTVGQKTVFNPGNKATRAEFVTMLMRGMGTYSDQKVAFKDVSEQNSSWSYDYISAAVEAGIIHGYPDQTFKTNQSISREEAMSMLSQAIKVAGVKSKVDKSEVDKILAGYKDSTKISAWAREQAALCVKEKIFVGNDGQLRPQEQINRAEIATIIARLLVQSKLVS